LVNLAGLSAPVIVFIIAMGAGMIGHDLLREQSDRMRAMEGAAIGTNDG
jgi:hypothetical protein